MFRIRRINQVTDCFVIISPHPDTRARDYAWCMPRLLTSVLIRSTIGISEPRYKHASDILGNVTGTTLHINWARSREDAQNLLYTNRNVFNLPASYGGGVRNYFAHLRFQIYAFRTLWFLKPQIIYACDLDTFIPSFIYRIFRPVLLIFDQFDPLSARVRNRFVRTFFDYFEFALVKKADIRITANLQRIPLHQSRTWIEIKNLFPFDLRDDNQRDKQDGFQLFYGGILSRDRGLIDLINIVRKKKIWRIDAYGQGPDRNSLIMFTGTNVAIHDYLPHNELMKRAQSADLYVAQYDPTIRNNRLTASNKLFEAAQLGIPLLTSKGTLIGDIVQKFELGWAVSYGDSKEIASALDEFASLSEKQRAEMVSNLGCFFQDEIQGQIANIKMLENIITSMTKSSRK